ncbi:zinc ribbon domain-containing protein [Pectinatus haikarae]|uniref:Zinc-ribbon domain-containing protein n=1 Tax=Pectinatus haikarae TaxID=349096 RepID=A0ABT9YA34_9FIRM|nr:zinc ribbon domain-containing protein [Pectinatus haikarae]MDQ0204700.1 hypothetical protein [Pectinatus haikarae]
MICHKCGREINDSKVCPYCGQDNNITIMTDQEKIDYGGVTIEENNDRVHHGSGYSQSTKGRQGRTAFRVTGGSWMSRLIFGIGILAIAAFVFFVALPFLSIAVLSILVIWAVFKLLG